MTLDQLQHNLGYTFRQPELLERALTHSSYANERKLAHGSNERLEFLGDSVLGFVAAEWLHVNHPNKSEGELTKMRAAAVCESALFGYAQEIGLGGALRLGRGEAATGGANRPSMVADAFEAVLAAMFLDGGIEPCKVFVHRFLQQGSFAMADSKTELQQIVQQNPAESVEYVLVQEQGPDHEKVFLVEVRLHSNVLGVGRGRSKKLAEQAAAAQALKLMGMG
ncbi:MAG: ribonuclease III [Oscillospiraceae bacterium]|nr:ribonuclease III [Oscillospiraceae bacterium]